MKFFTEAAVPDYPFRIDHRTPMLMMGSCFTETIGSYLNRYLFDITVNPFGVIYNPLSVYRSLIALAEKEAYTEDDMNQYNGLYFSFDHYTRFSHPDKKRALQNINQAFGEGKRMIRNADYLLITFGTAYVYRYRETNQVVCNCHKIPSSGFIRELLTPEAIVEEFSLLFDRLKKVNEKFKIIFTVSPVRHLKDGAHGNQVSKSTLLLAVDRICSQCPDRCLYFPSYEIVMDELRDYRFYAEDMVHPNDLAVRVIREKFASAFFSVETTGLIGKLDAVLRNFQHKPVHTGTPAHNKFLEERDKKLESLKAAHPYLQWSKLTTMERQDPIK
ncbi:MAG: GSCFA domain-containing protein [Bacteroidales bacterium]|nr:GSCFA domain-containing protein [Bacteroidales bacterium]